MKLVLGEFPRYTRHVMRSPCKDVPILMEKLDELALVFAAQAGSDDHELGGVGGVQSHSLAVLCSLELCLIISSLGLASRQRCLDMCLGLLYIVPWF